MKNHTKSKNNVLKTLRKLKGINFKELHKVSSVSINLLSFYEAGKSIPTRETVIKLAKGLEVNPDVLFLSFGYLPDHEMNIVREDPYYYMDKIQKMCKNHETRYSEENTNIDDLNIARTYDYIIKSMEERKNQSKEDT